MSTTNRPGRAFQSDICRAMPKAERLLVWAQDLPEGMRLGHTCNVPQCGKREHMALVDDLNYATRKRSAQRSYILPHLVKLEMGKSVGVKVPDGDTADSYAKWLRAQVQFRRELWHFTYRIEPQPDGLLKVTLWKMKGGDSPVQPKLCSVCGVEGCKVKRRRCRGCGSWFHPQNTARGKGWNCSPSCGHIARGLRAQANKPLPEELPLCACGCGKRVNGVYDYTKKLIDGSAVRAGEPRRFCKGHRIAKMGKCLACGSEFKLKQRKYYCSKKCQSATGYGWRYIGKKPWEVRPDKWKRVKCSVCGKFKWRKKCQQHFNVCSMSCRQKRSQAGRVKVPRDRELLQSLLDKGMTCADINRHFGAHPSSAGCRLTLLSLGLDRVVAGNWRSRAT